MKKILTLQNACYLVLAVATVAVLWHTGFDWLTVLSGGTLLGFGTYASNPPPGAGPQSQWQTSQQGWAKAERDRRAADLYAQAERESAGKDAIGRAVAMAKADYQIAQQGGGLGKASNIGAGGRPISERDWNFWEDNARQAYQDELLKRQVERESLKSQLDMLSANKEMLKSARQQMGGSMRTGGSYGISGVK